MEVNNIMLVLSTSEELEIEVIYRLLQEGLDSLVSEDAKEEIIRDALLTVHNLGILYCLNLKKSLKEVE